MDTEVLNDLTATRLCAEAMETPPPLPGVSEIWGVMFQYEGGERKMHHWVRESYCPLTDDAQAMALVKRFDLASYKVPNGNWLVQHPDLAIAASFDTDLNRAIVYCVAAMQSAAIRDGKAND